MIFYMLQSKKFNFMFTLRVTCNYLIQTYIDNPLIYIYRYTLQMILKHDEEYLMNAKLPLYNICY